jgi:putative membrane protein
MERKLYYGIATPGAVLTLIFGFWMMSFNWDYYLKATWMHWKLSLVFLMGLYHLYLGKLLYAFKYNRNLHTHIFYRWLNEVPVIFLIGIVLLVVLKPF